MNTAFVKELDNVIKHMRGQRCYLKDDQIGNEGDAKPRE